MYADHGKPADELMQAARPIQRSRLVRRQRRDRDSLSSAIRSQLLCLRTKSGFPHDRAVPIDLDRDVSHGWFLARVTGVLTIEELVTFLTTARAAVNTRAIPLLVDATAATTSI